MPPPSLKKILARMPAAIQIFATTSVLKIAKVRCDFGMCTSHWCCFHPLHPGKVRELRITNKNSEDEGERGGAKVVTPNWHSLLLLPVWAASSFMSPKILLTR